MVRAYHLIPVIRALVRGQTAFLLLLFRHSSQLYRFEILECIQHGQYNIHFAQDLKGASPGHGLQGTSQPDAKESAEICRDQVEQSGLVKGSKCLGVRLEQGE